MATRAEYAARPGRESLSKRLGKTGVLIKERDGHACCYCKATEKSSGAHLHLDHIVPKAHGGKDVSTNLVTACRSCNSAKQDMSLRAWASYAAKTLKLSFAPSAIQEQANKNLADFARGPLAKWAERQGMMRSEKPGLAKTGSGIKSYLRAMSGPGINRDEHGRFVSK